MDDRLRISMKATGSSRFDLPHFLGGILEPSHAAPISFLALSGKRILSLIGLYMPLYLECDCADTQESDTHEDERDRPAQRICEMLCGVKPDESKHGNDSGE
jgi:hypothetical protein